ncbi:MAG TPA: DEAD/DEAH box helicase [Opitutaceae bacterium]|jgi:superfamily II DNA or RNA helicase
MPALVLHLPPNLAAAAGRGAIAIKVDFDPAVAPEPALLPALALLQSWCGEPRPPRFIELSTQRMRELVAAAGALPVFAEGGRVGSWAHGDLLDAAAAAPAAAPSPPAAPRRRPPGKPEGEPMTIDGSEHYLAITLPSREHPAYAGAAELLRSFGFSLEPSNRKWWLRDRHKTLSFLAANGDRLRGEFGARFTPNFLERTSHLVAADLAAEASPAGGGWDVSVGLHAPGASEAALREAVDAGRTYAESDGKVILIDPSRLRRLGEAQRALAGDPGAPVAARRKARVAPARAAEVEDLLGEYAPSFRPPEEWAARTAALRDLSSLRPAPIPEDLSRVLRGYQRLGAAWLWHLFTHGLGGILADEMGLGKTLQALALLCAASGRGRPSLVVCPASLLENWRREAARFAPSLRVFVHHGESRLPGPADLAGRDLIITSYGTLARDADLFSQAEFVCAIGDEAQNVKNRQSQNAKALCSLRAEGRFLLTGTPVENSMDDLRSLFEFVMPGYLERVPGGARGEERAWLDERVKAKTARYILRRTKAAVAPELPARIEQVIWCEPSGPQAALYRSYEEQSERELFDLEASGAGEGALRLAALTQLLRLRQICCDPRLVAAAGAADDSAKLASFREILSQAVGDGHRLLVFSQFTSLLALLREELDAQGLGYCYLDGAMPAAARQAEVDRFQSPAGAPVFLLSLKAGGSGLNLTAADTVVHFDPWWNPAAEAQASDRAHRIGQTRVVTIYKLVCPGTVEERVLGLQEAKRKLLAGVFEASDAASARLSLPDLRDLLRAP